MYKIAVDGMANGQGPTIIIDAINTFLDKNKDVEIYLYGQESVLKPLITKHLNKIKFIHTQGVLTGNEHNISLLLRDNPDISMFRAMRDTASYDGLVSCGPTQALIAGTHFIIGRIQGVQRMAIAPVLPMPTGPRVLLDAGANVNLTPEQLMTLAIGGCIYHKILFNSENPSVGLLNIGTEDGKGRELEIKTNELLKQNTEINYIGNVEPEDALCKKMDVILADGFSGNIFLKSIEGFYTLFKKIFKNELYPKFRNKLGLLFLKKDLKRYKRQFSDEETAGAVILGAKKVVIKCHGNAKTN